MLLTTIRQIYKPILVKEIIGPVVVVAISLLVYILIKNFVKKIFSKNNKYINKRRARTIELIITNLVKYGLIIIDVLVILEIFGISTKGIITSLGAASVVLGLALQDTLKDILAGFSIIVENQFTVGDTVTINNFKGEVVALGIKSTKIKSYTGEVLIISNRNVTQVINHSLAKSLALVNVQVAYEMKTEKVERVLTNLCKRLTSELPNIKGEVTLLGITDLKDSGIEYRISVETKPMKHIEVSRMIMREVKLELEKHNIVIPYNQLVIHNA